MSKSFNIGEDVLNISGDIEAYNQLWLKVKDVSKKYFVKFVSELKNIDDVDEFMEKAYHLGTEVHDEMFDEFADEFMSLGCFDFSSNYLHNHRLYEKLMNPFFSYLQFMKSSCEYAEEMGDIEKFQHDFNKMSRTQLSGGGFGIAGALSGMLMASAYNTASGLVYDAINARKNWKTDNKVADLKAQIYQNAAPELMMTMLFTLENQLVIIADLLHIDYVEDEAKSTAILNNILSMKIKPEFEKKAFLAALQANPYNYDAYKYMLKRYSNEEADILEVAAYFGMDFSAQVKEAHEYDSFYFKEPKNRNRVANRMSGIFEQLKITYDDFVDCAYWRNLEHYDDLLSIIEKIKLALVQEEKEHQKIAELGGHLPDIAEIKAYYEGEIDSLQKIADDVKVELEKRHKKEEEIKSKSFDDEYLCNLVEETLSKSELPGVIKIGKNILNHEAHEIFSLFGGKSERDIKNYLYLNDNQNKMLVTSDHIYYVGSQGEEKKKYYYYPTKNISVVEKNSRFYIQISDDEKLIRLSYLNKEVYTFIANFISVIMPIGYFKTVKYLAETNGGNDCACLGECYEKGQGVEKNEIEAIKAYMKGIILYNEPWCQFIIGRKYLEDGFFGVFNKSKTLYLFNQSLAQKQGTERNITRRADKLRNVVECSWEDLFKGDEFNNYGLREYVDNLLAQRYEIEKSSIDKSNFIKKFDNAQIFTVRDDSSSTNLIVCPLHRYNGDINVFLKTESLGRILKEDDLIAYIQDVENIEMVIVFLTFGIVKFGTGKGFYYKDIVEFSFQNNKFSIRLKDNTEICLAEYSSLVREIFPIVKTLNCMFDKEPICTGIRESGIVYELHNVGEVVNYDCITKWCTYNANICKSLKGFYWTTDIKSSKSQKAISSYASNYQLDPQYIYALYDDTIFGSASDGFFIHYYGMASSCMKCFAPFNSIRRIEVKGNDVVIWLDEEKCLIFWSFKNDVQAYEFMELLSEMLICDKSFKYNDVYPDCDRIELCIN